MTPSVPPDRFKYHGSPIRNRVVIFGVHLFIFLLITAGMPANGKPVDQQPADLYVAPDGTVQNDGTKSNPLPTLRNARKAVRERLSDGPDDDLVVQIAGGRYTLRGPMKFGPKDAPSSDHRVIYRAAPGETPVFSGGRRISGWEENADGSWSMTLPSVRDGNETFDELFVDGHRAQPARYPNEGTLRIETIGPDRRTRFTFYEGDVPDSADGDQLRLLYFHDWSISRVPVASINRSDRQLTTAFDVGPDASHYKMGHFTDHPRYVLTGDVDFVDRPGEWFLNEETGKLTYYPRKDQEPGEVRTTVPVARSLLEISGTPDEPVRNLSFHGLSFRHCSFPLPEKGYAAGQATGHDDRTNGDSGRTFVDPAIQIDFARQVVFRNTEIAHVGGGGIWFRQQNRQCRLIGSTVQDTGGNGVMVGTGSHNARRVTANALVVNNHVDTPGQRFFGAVGIWAGIVRDARIMHNHVSNTPYTGISLGWQWNPTPTPAARNRVSYNHIHHVMQTLSDGGGIYTLGRHPDSALRGNYIHHVPEAAGRAESNGMFLDQGTKGFRIEHNVIEQTYHSPLRFHQAHQNLVRLNLLRRRTKNTPVIRYNATPKHRITRRNNTVITREDERPPGVENQINEAGPKPELLEQIGD